MLNLLNPKKKRYSWDELDPNGKSTVFGDLVPTGGINPALSNAPTGDEIQTLGGTEGADMTVRPRIVPPQIDPSGINNTVIPRLLEVVPSPTLPTSSVPTDSPAPDPSANLVVPPPQRTPRQIAEDEYSAVLNKDYSITKDANGNVISRGKDRDKTFNWKDILRSIGLGALKGMAGGGLGGAIGGAVAGGIRGSFDRNFDNKLQDGMFVLPRLQQRVAVARDQEQYDANMKRQQALTDSYLIKPIQAQQKLDQDAEYKRNVIELGQKKADQLKIYQDAIVQLRQEGGVQNERKIKLLEDQFEEAKRKNTEAEKDKDLDREARVKVAQIMADNRTQVAQINQDGANYRNKQNLDFAKQRHQELLDQRQKEAAAGNVVNVQKIDAQIANGKARMKAAGFSDAEINELFGGQ